NSFESKEREHAEFYISMDALEEAKKITINITDEEERELLDIKIKESYKFNKNRVDMIASGIHYSKRSIENGRHSFTQYYVPVDFDLYDEKWGHFYIDADILHLYDEFKGNDESNTLTYGLGSTYNKTKSSTNTTFLGNIGFKSKYIDLEIGSTPLGTDIVPKIMGSISLHTGYEKFNLNLKLVRKRDDDSMLSSVGESLEAKGRDIKWGRIFRSGLEFDLSYSSIFSYSLSLASYPSIEGHHVKQNEELKAVAIMSYSPNSESFTYIDYSFIAVYDEYNFNSDFFTYGHGGYFSPQEFMLGSFVVDIANIINDEASWKLKASVGYEQFKVDEVTQYPVSDANSAGLYGSVDGYRESGFTYNLTLGSSYRLTKQLDVIGALSYEKMHTFKDISIGFSFIYSFDKKRKVNLYNFHDGHRVKQLF
ncbi:MAG: cellulose synthase subunit BcsC-related outer membrane protein, partial [Campylobacterota bacterium]|nr:cellulose synthase subunit BcsC-related outer membrane protein [Campylobacterota bacterium]